MKRDDLFSFNYYNCTNHTFVVGAADGRYANVIDDAYIRGHLRWSELSTRFIVSVRLDSGHLSKTQGLDFSVHVWNHPDCVKNEKPFQSSQHHYNLFQSTGIFRIGDKKTPAKLTMNKLMTYASTNLGYDMGFTLAWTPRKVDEFVQAVQNLDRLYNLVYQDLQTVTKVKR